MGVTDKANNIGTSLIYFVINDFKDGVTSREKHKPVEDLMLVANLFK